MPIYDVYPNDLIEQTAKELKKIELIKPPKWAAFAKTGAHRERPPVEADWWYKRAAAVLRSVYVLGPIGVSKLRTKYGGKKRRGHQTPEFRKGSGSIIRKALQQLEKAELIRFIEKGIHKGRVVTPKGASLLDKAAIAVKKSKPKKALRDIIKDEAIHMRIEEKREPRQAKTAKEIRPDPEKAIKIIREMQKEKAKGEAKEQRPAEPKAAKTPEEKTNNS